MDTDKSGANEYGDFVLWSEIIDKAREVKTPVIFITDDRKDDWWLRFNGQIVGPHPELVNELVSEADVPFYMYQADPFMEQAGKYLNHKVKQEAIAEVREVKRLDEGDVSVDNHEASVDGTTLSPSLVALTRHKAEFLEALRATGRDPFELSRLAGSVFGLNQLTTSAMQEMKDGALKTLLAEESRRMQEAMKLSDLTRFGNEVQRAQKMLNTDVPAQHAEASRRMMELINTNAIAQYTEITRQLHALAVNSAVLASTTLQRPIKSSAGASIQSTKAEQLQPDEGSNEVPPDSSATDEAAM